MSKYFYRGNKSYDIKKLSSKELNYNYYDLNAKWKDKDEGDKVKIGKFYSKNLKIIK